MNINSRIYNVSREYYIKRKQALKGIDRDCTLAWVVEGESVRDLTLAESIAARNEQARLRDPLPYAEMFGLRFEGPKSSEDGKRNRNMMVWEASRFVSEELARREAA